MTTYAITENSTVQNATPDTTYSGVEDTLLFSALPTNNYNTDINLPTLNNQKSLIKFTGLASVPNETVTSATIYLYMKTYGSSNRLDIRQMLQSYGLTTCTWNTYDGTNNWNTGGAQGDGTDRVSTPESQTTTGSTTGVYEAFDVTSWAQDVIDGTIATDEGLHLTNGAGFAIYSSSDDTDGQRPELIVVTTATGGATIPTFIKHYRNQGML